MPAWECRRFRTWPGSRWAPSPRVREEGLFKMENQPSAPHPPRLGEATSPRKRGEVKEESSASDQRAAAILERAERFRRRDGRAHMIEIARVLRLGWLLHLEQIRVMQL